MLGIEDKTLCGWPLTTGELKQMRSVNTIHVTCKRCLEKLESYSEDNKIIMQKGSMSNG